MQKLFVKKLNMSKFFQLPINYQTDETVFLSDSKSESNAATKYEIIPTIETGWVKFYYVEKAIANDLTKIFNHFEIENHLIDDLIFLSSYQTTESKALYKDRAELLRKEIEYKKAFDKLMRSKILKNYPETSKVLKSIEKEKVKPIEDKLKRERTKKSIHLKKSRKPKNPTKYNFSNETNHSVKECWKNLVEILVDSNIKNAKDAKLIVTYVLGYFQLIPHKHFKDSTTFNNFYKNSFWKNGSTDDVVPLILGVNY